MCKDQQHISEERPKFVYLITSLEPVFAAGILPDDSTALLAFLSPLAGGVACPCCIWNLLGETQQEFFGGTNQSSMPPFPLASPSDWRGHMRQFMRTRLWLLAQDMYRPSDTDSNTPEYFVLIDLDSSKHSVESTRAQLALFQQQLILERPHAAVPFHPCNTVDSAAGSDTVITSVYDTHFVAVHMSASKLLLPLDEELFSLVCHLMLRGSVMQFQVGIREMDNTAACHLADTINQHVMMHFVSSLVAKEFILALPFSPRIQNPSRPPYFMLSSGGEYTADFSDDACPVQCSFYYWYVHSCFTCCLSANSGQTKTHDSAAYNADAAYAEIAEHWQLPKAHDLACEHLTAQNYVKINVAENGQHGFMRQDLSHALPKFGLSLSAPPVTLDDGCSDDPDSSLPRTTSAILHIFKLTLQPTQLQLQPTRANGTSTLRVQLQITLSAPDDSHSAADDNQFKAVFGSVAAMYVRTQCHGSQTVAMVDIRQLRLISITDHPRQSAKAPWFYLPYGHRRHRQWFEVTSNTSRDTLRILIADVLVPTHCDDFTFLSANASVLLRGMASVETPCSMHVVSAETHNVSFSAQEVARRASVLVEDPPDDLFDDGDEVVSDAVADGLNSDFACAGPNRDWEWGEQTGTSLPEDMEVNGGINNMCLFQNICWMGGALTLFLPKSFQFLDTAIPAFFDFASLEFDSFLAVNLSPFSSDDGSRTRW